MSRISSKQYFLALSFLFICSLLVSAAGESSSHEMVKGEEGDSSELKSPIPDIFINTDLASSKSRELLMSVDNCHQKKKQEETFLYVQKQTQLEYKKRKKRSVLNYLNTNQHKELLVALK